MKEYRSMESNELENEVGKGWSGQKRVAGDGKGKGNGETFRNCR